MSKIARLLDLIEIFGRRKYAVSARMLAGELGVSVRTVYRDEDGRVTDRRIWPFALIYFDEVMNIVSWCETRNDFRHFRADRVQKWSRSRDSYPLSRLQLLQQWQEKIGIPLHDDGL